MSLPTVAWQKVLPPDSSLVLWCMVIRRWGNFLVGSQKWIARLLLIAYGHKMHGVWLISVFNLVLLLFLLAAGCVRWYVPLVVWY